MASHRVTAILNATGQERSVSGRQLRRLGAATPSFLFTAIQGMRLASASSAHPLLPAGALGGGGGGGRSASGSAGGGNGGGGGSGGGGGGGGGEERKGAGIEWRPPEDMC
jgi:hypothetical protein